MQYINVQELINQGRKVIGMQTHYVGRSFNEIRKSIIEEHFDNICKAFGLHNSPEIRELFYAATCGSGNEWMEINQLNSSTLLAFLCFCNVSEGNEIEIEGDKYSKVLFEVKSPLPMNKVDKRKTVPSSNMDIVLLNEQSALFLESKFSEYVKPKKAEVSSYYNELYTHLFREGLKFKNFQFQHQTWQGINGERAYMEGVKQMISHYLGIQNCINNPKKWKVADLCGKRIKLGEIVYRFGEKDDPASKFGHYSRISSELLSRLKNKDPQIDVIDKVLPYQEIFSGENASLLTKKTREFYGL